MQCIVGASLIDLVCSAQRKFDELDICELKACSCTTVHGIVNELSLL